MFDNFYVITAIFNPFRYKIRKELYDDFERYVEKNDIILYTIESAYGDRNFEVTSPCDETDVQLRTNHEMWHKEKMLNLIINRLPQNWEYVAWIDADLKFARPDWAKEVVHLLQHYDFVQMFDTATDLGPNYEVLKTHKGFISAFYDGFIDAKTLKSYEKYHPGFAWAARREALNKVGGLIDYAILGSADRHMAQALVGNIAKSHPKSISRGYKEQLLLWQDRCNKYIKGNVGFMPGTVFHYWHGPKAARQYISRWKILADNKYDPEFDLKPDTQGLWQFTDRRCKLRYDIMKYFQTRNEDSKELDVS